MQIDIQQPSSKSVHVTISGRLDTLSSAELNAQLRPFLDSAIEMRLHCGELLYIASAGLRSLLIIHDSLEAAGGKLVMQNVQPAVMHILELTDYVSFLHIEP